MTHIQKEVRYKNTTMKLALILFNEIKRDFFYDMQLFAIKRINNCAKMGKNVTRSVYKDIQLHCRSINFGPVFFCCCFENIHKNQI